MSAPSQRGGGPEIFVVRRLAPRQVRGFFHVGFIVVPEVFSEPGSVQMRAAFDRLEQTVRTLTEPAMVRGPPFVVERIADQARRIRIHRIVWCGAGEPLRSVFGVDSPNELRFRSSPR